MSQDNANLAQRPKPVGVIDIGSNSVRLVIYSGVTRAPIPIYNEKTICALGRELESTGKLNPEGITKAIDTLRRFKTLTDGMELARLDILGTAAIRDASDGPDFVCKVQEETGLIIKVISGKQEARRSALGVLCGIPTADGMVADLGGGSLELVDVCNGKFGEYATLPLGTLRLAETISKEAKSGLLSVNEHLAKHKWITGVRGRTVYAVGGAWRTLARVCIAHMNYPLHVLDNFTLTRQQAVSLFGLIAHLGPQTLKRIRGVEKTRLATLPLAAMMLERLVEIGEPNTLVFSIYGMREGQFFKSLPSQYKKIDPLISAAEEWCRSSGRNPQTGYEAFEWMSALFPNEKESNTRLRLAACLLRDVCWSEHPDYRAEQAFLRVLRLPFMGLEHEDRAGLALALFYRYRTDGTTPTIDQAHTLLDTNRVKRVHTIGLCLRLSFSLTAGMADMLDKTRLERSEKELLLSVPANEPMFSAGSFPKRLARLANHLELSCRIVRQ
ncbi:MAG: exopolyphosphatase [Rhodospirillaceae bacterium]